MLEKNAKIFIAGHRGLVGSAIWNNLQQRGYTNLVGRSHKELDLLDGTAVKKFFDEERPEAVVLGCRPCGWHYGKPAIPGGLYLPESANPAERNRREFPSRSKEAALLGKHLHLPA